MSMNTAKGEEINQQGTFETVLNEEQSNRYNSYEKNNMLDITYGESLQEQEQVMHFIHGEKAEIHIQQMMDHSNPQHLQQKLDKLALQAEELIAKVHDRSEERRVGKQGTKR